MREVKTFENEGNGGGFVMGMICGAAVGAAVGLLLAPKAGSELREQIYQSTGRLRRSATDGYVAAVDTVSGAVEDVIERGKKAAHRGQETYETVRKSAVDATNAASKAVNERL